MGYRINHIHLKSPDPRKTAEWYVKAFDFEITAYARTRLAHYKCPTSVDFATTLPRNPSGKLLKRELREPYWKGHERRIN